MSEKHIPTFESHESGKLDSEKLKEHNERLRENREKAAEKAEHDQPSIEKIRESIEKRADSKDDALKYDTSEAKSPVYTSANLGKMASKRMRIRVQKQLPRPDRAFSKVIHQPVVEAVSNVAEGTIARPSGLLFAGLCSAVSSIAILYICRHYGYEYNFAIGLFFLAVGFVAGILLEGLYKMSRRLFIRRS